MTPPLNSPNNNNHPSFSVPSNGFSGHLWPKHVIATPLKGVSLEVSSYPPSVAVMFDVLTLLQAGGAAKAGKAAASAARGVAKPAGQAASKAASKALAEALKPGRDISVLESLKTFLAGNPSLSFLAPVVDVAILLGRFSPLQ